MTIATYSDLQSAVADWLNRQDLTARIPDFIALAEARFNRTIRTRDMIKRETATTSNQFVPVPDDWLETYQLELDPMQTGIPWDNLRYISPNEASLLKAHSAVGPTRAYTIIDSKFELIPAPNYNSTTGTSTVNLTCTYYARIPALSNTNPTNWVLTKAPDLYLYSSLLNAAPYLANDERIAVWSQMVSAIYDELMNDSERAERSRTFLVARRRGFN